MRLPPQDPLQDWFDALERRHLHELTFSEARRGLEALSSLYVERRERVARGGVLDGRGKRAAFALFYGPLHFAVTRRIVRELQVAGGIARIHDLGCGSGAAGAAWALECRRRPALLGIDLHPWAVEEARWTWSRFELEGSVRRGRLEGVRFGGRKAAVLLAYTANELSDAARAELLDRLLDAHARGARLLVIEPIARRVAPWFGGWAKRFRDAGGRADEWRFAAEMPERWRLLDRSAGLDHRQLTARSLLLDGV